MSPATITPHSNIRELVAALPLAEDVLEAFGLKCGGCGVGKYETVEQGATAHGLRVEPIIAALNQARLSGRMPTIMNDDRRPQRRALGAFSRRAAIGHVIPIMSGKGGVGKSLTTALLAVGLRRQNLRVGILDADVTGPSIPRLFGLRTPLALEENPNAPADASGRRQPLMVPARQSARRSRIVSSEPA